MILKKTTNFAFFALTLAPLSIKNLISLRSPDLQA